MATNVLNTGVAASDSYLARTMIPAARFAGVWKSNEKYNILTQMADLFGAPKQVGGNRKIERAKIGSIGVTNEVSTRTAVGQNLRLGWADSEWQRILKDHMVACSATGAQARVISTEPGFITIAPWTDSSYADTSTFAAAEFAVGVKIVSLYNASTDANSNYGETQQYIPESDYNYCGVSRATCYISRDDLSRKTYELIDGKYWAFAQELMMKNRFAYEEEKKLLTGVRNFKNGIHTTGGLLWAARTYGRRHLSTAATLTQSKLHDIIQDLQDNVGTQTPSEIVVLCGSEIMRNFQEIIGDKYITPTGVDNTIGGKSVEGIDVNSYKFLGTKVKFVMYPAFNDVNLFPEISSVTGKLKSSSMALFVNTDPVQTTQGSLPALERFYYGEKPIILMSTPGTVNMDNMSPTSVNTAGYIMTPTGIDGCTAGILSDGGVYVNGAERHALYELAL